VFVFGEERARKALPVPVHDKYFFSRWVFDVFNHRNLAFRDHYDVLAWDQMNLQRSRPKTGSAESPTWF
jgi:hypothetical protein